jgi:hypothetical protein
VISPMRARFSLGSKSRQFHEFLIAMRQALSHVVLYVGGASVSSAAAVEEVNRFSATLPGGFGIRVVNVLTQIDGSALDGWLPPSRLIESATPHPGPLPGARGRGEPSGGRSRSKW